MHAAFRTEPGFVWYLRWGSSEDINQGRLKVGEEGLAGEMPCCEPSEKLSLLCKQRGRDGSCQAPFTLM